MSMQIVLMETRVSLVAEGLYGHEPSWLESIRSSALTAMGRIILRDASTFERIEPKRGEPHYGESVVYRWYVGIECDTAERDMRIWQMAQERAAGRRDAVAIIQAAAARYDKQQGGFGGLIASALRDAAAECA